MPKKTSTTRRRTSTASASSTPSSPPVSSTTTTTSSRSRRRGTSSSLNKEQATTPTKVTSPAGFSPSSTTSPPNSGSGENEAVGSSQWDKDPLLDICLLETMEKFPPLSYHREFAIVNICAEIKQILGQTISPKDVGDRLDELYALSDLDRDGVDVLTMKSQTELEEEELDDVDLDFALPDSMI